MKNVMNITANLDEPTFLKCVIERLASRHVDKGYTKASVPKQWKAIESSCIQADVNGTFDLHVKNNKNEQEEIPFIGAFLFTCIKEMNGMFNLEWSVSLS
jgi:hypothetical protein